MWRLVSFIRYCNTQDFYRLCYILIYDIYQCYDGLVLFGIALVRFISSFDSFAVIREIWPVAPCGELSVFWDDYRCDYDIYQFEIIFGWFVSNFDSFSIFRKTGRFRRYLGLPGFWLLFFFGVLIPNFGNPHDILFKWQMYFLFSF